jgi:sugar transferase (PEP-CTERM system associated)
MLIYNNRYIPYRNVICFLVDSAGIFFSVIGAYLVLYWKSDPGSVQEADVVYLGIAIVIFAQFIMYVLDLYDFNVAFSPYDITFSVIFTIGFVYIVIGVFSSVTPRLAVIGGTLYVMGLFLFTFLIIWRFFLEVYISSHSGFENVMILGDGPIAAEIAELIGKSRRLGFNLKGVVAKETIAVMDRNGLSELTPDSSRTSDADRLNVSAIREIVKTHEVNNIVVAMEDRRRAIPVRELLELKVMGVRVVEWPEFYERLAGKIPIRNLPPSYFVFSDGFRISLSSRIVSRILDVSVAAVSLALLFPLFVVVAAAIRLDSRGPVFYLQKRVGKNGRTFDLIKFRTMVEDAERVTGAVWATDNDPRTTRVGKYLRKYRIDEFPQFLNVLMGDMSVVGPRPERPEFVGVLEKELPYYHLRHSIKPGATGWAQVKFSYSGTIEESKEKLEYDLFYLKNKFAAFDLYIIFKTIKILLQGRGAR